MNLFYRIFFSAIGILTLAFSSINSSERINQYIYQDSTLSSSADSLLILEERNMKMAEGRKLYEAKCQKCHVLYEPGQFRLKKWVRNLEEMKHKAELMKDEYDLILEYLSSNCKK